MRKGGKEWRGGWEGGREGGEAHLGGAVDDAAGRVGVEETVQ
jgi:hypothetical protein